MDISELEKLTGLKCDPFLGRTSKQSSFGFRKGQNWAKLLRVSSLSKEQTDDFRKYLATTHQEARAVLDR